MENKTFKQYPSLKSYFETSDGVCFFKEDDAKSHAKKLDNKTIKEVKRAESSPKQRKPKTTKAATN